MKKLIIFALLLCFVSCQPAFGVVESVAVPERFTPNGSLTTFNFTFRLVNQSDLTATLRTDSTGGDDDLTLNVDYTLSATNNDFGSGGTVTFTTAPASGTTLVLERDMERSQSVNLIQGQAMPAESTETTFDKMMMSIQDIDKDLSFAITVPHGDPTSALSLEVPNSILRASKFFTWDSDGNPTATAALTTGTASFSSYGEGVVDKTDAGTTMAYLQGIPVFNVKNAAYGAAGDGDGAGAGTDDTAAITAAIVAANAAGGGEVNFPPGIYNISSVITVLANVTLKGNRATIYLLDNSDSDMFGVAASNITFDGLIINGNKANNAASAGDSITLSGTVDNLTVKNCEIFGSAGNCVGFAGTMTNLKFLNNNFHDSASGKALLSMTLTGADTATNSEFISNRFSGSIRGMSSGLSTATPRWIDIRVIGNYFENIDSTEGLSLEINDYDGLVVADNVITDGWRGMSFNTFGPGHATITGNLIKDQLNWGMELSSANALGGIDVTGNTIENCVGGIIVGQATGNDFNINIVGNNLIKAVSGATFSVINFRGVRNGNISDNTIYIDDADSGGCINITNSASGTAADSIQCSNNVIYFSDTTRTATPDAIFISAANKVKVSSNLISIGDDSGTSGFIHLNSDTKNDIWVENNTIIYRGGSASSNYGINLTSTDSIGIYIKDNFIQNTAVGIDTTAAKGESSNVSVTNNTVIDCTDDVLTNIGHFRGKVLSYENSAVFYENELVYY